MSYLEERKELQKEYEELEKMIKAYEYHFKKNPSSMRKNWMQPSDEYLKTQLKIEYNYWDTENDSNMLMDYKLKRFRFEEVKSELSKTEKEWEKERLYKKISEYIPQHVSGRTYAFSDGCATICMWFGIIVFVIVFLISLVN